jgi:hypothetical protein
MLRTLGGGTGPRHHQAIVVQPQTECAAAHPPRVGAALPAKRREAAACTDGLEPLAPLGGDAAEPRRRGPADLGPVLLGLQETQEPRALGEPGDQRPLGARPAALAGPMPDTLERLPPSQGPHLTGPAGGRGGVGHGVPLLSAVVAQGDETIPCGQAALLCGAGR